MSTVIREELQTWLHGIEESLPDEQRALIMTLVFAVIIAAIMLSTGVIAHVVLRKGGQSFRNKIITAGQIEDLPRTERKEKHYRLQGNTKKERIGWRYWIADLVEERLLQACVFLIPCLIVYSLLPSMFYNRPVALHWMMTVVYLCIVWTIVNILCKCSENLLEALNNRPKYTRFATDGLFQMLRLLIVIIGIVVSISVVVGRDLLTILTALGAGAAVLLFVFKDTILGFVASVQLTANDMVKENDWIVLENYGINGKVESVNLTTVKIRNWDNSISTVPPYWLVSNSFHNYEDMRENGGRRVLRSILIDMKSIRRLTEAEIEVLREKGRLDGISPDIIARRYNIQLLRYALEHFISIDSRVRRNENGDENNFFHMIRQLEPTATGLPLQLYFFTKEIDWTRYERVQSDIMDEVYVIANDFGLSIFQYPTGEDVKLLNGHISANVKDMKF